MVMRSGSACARSLATMCWPTVYRSLCAVHGDGQLAAPRITWGGFGGYRDPSNPQWLARVGAQQHTAKDPVGCSRTCMCETPMARNGRGQPACWV